MRVSSVELHQKLGQTIDKARIAPVVVTKHERDHVVIISAERYAVMAQAMRKSRLTGSLTAEERTLAAVGEVPSDTEQDRYLAELTAKIEQTL
jgi:PHD/YefM family antitoxin component YafN of YafNO toxin-antitoxin module